MSLMTEVETHQVTIRMKKDLARKLKVYAAQNDTSVTDIMDKLVTNFLYKANKNNEMEVIK